MFSPNIVHSFVLYFVVFICCLITFCLVFFFILFCFGLLYLAYNYCKRVTFAHVTQNLLGVVPAPTNDAGSTAELLPREGRTGELRRGGPSRGLFLPLTAALPFPHPCIFSHMGNAGILFTPAQMYTREN